MLKHEDIPQTQPPTAAQVRVTPEELAAAVTALQIRKEGQPGTIAIGDAVEELGLDVTPEEILQVVQGRRHTVHKQNGLIAGKRKWIISLSFTLLCFTGLGAYSVVSNSYPDSSQLVPATTPYALEPRILALDPAAPKQAISTLAEAPNGRTVYCSVAAIETAAMSRNVQMGPQQEINQPVSQLNWPVVKHDKQLYIRGWVRMPLSKEAARISVVELFNKPNLPQLGVSPQPVTLKLDLQTSGRGLGYQRLNADGTGVFVFHNPRLTVHAYEKW